MRGTPASRTLDGRRHRIPMGEGGQSTGTGATGTAGGGRPVRSGQTGRMEYTHLGRTGLMVSRLCLGTMNFGPLTTPTSRMASWIRPTSWASTSSIPPTAMGAPRARPARSGTAPSACRMDRGDHRGLVRLRRWASGAHGAGHQGVRRDGRLAERGQAVGAQHPAGVRGLAAKAANGPHRPLPDAPRRSGHAMGRDLAGHGGADHPGEDPLRGFIQLCRMAPGRGQQRGRFEGPARVWSASSRSTTS